MTPALIIIGAGFAGLGMAIQLKKRGFHDFVILEKGDELGGTWRDNTYPGCACDIPSHMYSFSFDLNPGWTRMFAHQPEIRDYLHRTADKYGLRPHIRYGSAVESLEFDDTTQHWDVTTTDGHRYRTRIVISGIGALHIPAFPDLPGIQHFTGKVFHSARWDHTYDLTGKRVAVIGTGASAIQFVPHLAEQVARLHVFQRTPPWIQPKPDRTITHQVRQALARIPGATRALRTGLYWTLEARAAGFAVDPRLSHPQERQARRHLERQITDPSLRAKLTPDYTIGCKRVLLSDDYYPALTRPNVHLITDSITEMGPNSITTGAGEVLDVDCIIYGTGFKVIDALTDQRIVGRNGLKIQDAWKDGVIAYRGITVAGFPNFFMLLGPNTGLGHNSVVFMIEVQIQHILSCLRLLRDADAVTIEVTPSAMHRYTARIHRRLRKAVWSQGGCQSWYLDGHGVNTTLWPGFTFEYWAGTRTADPAHYTVSPRIER